MSCHTKRHNTVGAYRQGCRCAGSKRAKASYDKAIRTGRAKPRLVDPTGSRRRVQALAAIGWPLGMICLRMGLVSSKPPRFLYEGKTISVRSAEAIARIYDELSMTPGPSTSTRKRALRKGWPPPLAWDDDSIDDPEAKPAGHVTTKNVDELAVLLAVRGQLGDRKLARVDAHEAIRRMRERGVPTAEIARRANVSERTVHRQGHETTTTAAA